MYAPDIEKLMNDPGYWKERAYQAETKLEAEKSTLLDQFACAALTGYFGSDAWRDSTRTVEHDAAMFYEQAAAMMAERERRGE